MPIFFPLSLISLLYTIIALFAYQGHRIIHNIGAVFRVFVPLILYFIVMWTSTFALIYHLTRREVPQAGHDGVYGYETAVVQAFTADFVSRHVSLECAFFMIQIRPGACDRCRNCGVWCQLGAGVSSHHWTLIEVPVLLGLTWVALYPRHKLDWNQPICTEPEKVV